MANPLATHLRALSDEELATLLALRPDLVAPVATDLSALAARAQSRVSVARALDQLDRFTLEMLDGLRLGRDATGTTSLKRLLGYASAARPAVDPSAVRRAVQLLRERALVIGPPETLQVVAGVDEVCPGYPAGLGRPAAQLSAPAARLCADAPRLRRAVLAAPAAARAVLERLAAGPPVGACPAHAVSDPDTPVGWLIDRDLLVVLPDGHGPTAQDPMPAETPAPAGDLSPTQNPMPADDPSLAEDPPSAQSANGADPRGRRVELPREVGILLRREVGPLGPLHLRPERLAGTPEPIVAVDAAGAGQAMEAVRHTEMLLEALAAEPAAVLRSGGLGARDLRRLARVAGIAEPAAATLLEVAAEAGLLGEVSGERGAADQSRFLPAAGYDQWLSATTAPRWERLARSWLSLRREPHLAGTRDERDRLRAVLSVELDRVGAPAIRVAALERLAEASPGTPGDAEQILAVLDWLQPRRFHDRTAARATSVRAALADAALLGLTARGALTGYGRLLLDQVRMRDTPEQDDDPLGLRKTNNPALGARQRACDALTALLPVDVDHFLVQADLTVVVPGPAEPELAAELSLIAENESAGAASVHRLTESGLRRALDAGYTAADLHALLARRSRTPVPQSLTYLIDDVARRHGGLRVGTAGCYLRSQDEALLAEVVVDRRLHGLGLRRLAPTVVVCGCSSTRLVAALREAGYPAVAEDASGAAVLIRQRLRRAPPRRPGSGGFTAEPVVSPARLVGVVEELRRGDRAARAARRTPGTVRSAGSIDVHSHTQALAVLQQAVRDRSLVWVGYVDAHGATASRLVRPVSMGQGFLRAQDDRNDVLHTFALHRITAAVPEP